jgi:hypothetical protein
MHYSNGKVIGPHTLVKQTERREERSISFLEEKNFLVHGNERDIVGTKWRQLVRMMIL